MRLTQAQQRAVQRIGMAAMGRLGPESVAAEVTSALGQAISWDGFRLFTIDPETHGVNRLLAASAHDAEMRQRWLRDSYQRDVNVALGPFHLADRIRSGFRAIMIHERLDNCYGVTPAIRSAIDDRIFYRSYHQHRERFHPGVTLVNAILVNFPVGARWVAILQAYRIDSTQSFTRSDLVFLRMIAPKVGEAIDAALRREQLARYVRGVPGDGASGVLVVHRDQGVRYASAASEAWLEELRRLPAGRETLLPSTIWAAIAGVQAGGEMARTTVALPVGVAAIEASPGGSDGSVAIVISAPRREDIIPPANWGLTPAEERVVARAIRGESNRDVFQTLSISENTVEWHLRRVFARLEIQSRGQLSARLPSIPAGPGLASPARSDRRPARMGRQRSVSGCG